MPKIYKLNPASQTPAKAAAESYKAPAPPKDGRVIGLDCHPDIFTAALLEGQTPHDARKVGSRQDLTLEELLQWSKKDLTPKDLIVMEAGGNSFAVCKRLRETGRRAIVLESCHVGKHAKSYADNDKMAATRIAMVYLAGNAPAVWVPDEATFSRRELLHAHRNAVAEHTAATNSFKSFLNGHAIRLGKRSLKEKSTRAWIRTRRSDWSELEKCLIEDHFKHIDYTDKRRKELLLQITMQVEADPMMLRCMKLLGIGIVNAFALMAIIGDIRRFENPRKLVAYVGLNPGKRTSGTYKDVKVEVGGRGRGDLRYLLVQGAQAVLRMGKATAMGQWGWRIFARKGNRNIAVVAIARKLLVQVWHLLMGNPPTLLENDKSLTTKLVKVGVTLGTELRGKLGLGKSLAQCAQILRDRISTPAAVPS